MAFATTMPPQIIQPMHYRNNSAIIYGTLNGGGPENVGLLFFFLIALTL